MKNIEEITYLECEIKALIEEIKRENECVNFNNKHEFNNMIYINIYKEDSIGNELAINSFNNKGCQAFCNNMKVILSSMENYWKEEFEEELCDTMLSPHDLLKTYIYCKAKSFYTK
jgi:hypothetical protein|tara:strand:- start:1203 stop:1550 length:348 start_codon:yes stop_codon:yes gene_type:complete